MTYPAINRGETRAYFDALKHELPSELPVVRNIEKGEDLDWEAIAKDLVAKISKLVEGDPVKKRGDSRGAKFENEAAPLIHRYLPTHEALADPEFWAWLAVYHFSDIIHWRYDNDPNSKNFGIGSASENLLFRIWLKGEVAYADEAEEPYELAAVGDIDFWRSHIFRQSYADARIFARAFLEFQFPKSAGRKPRLSINEIRELAKRLKRTRSNLLFELMDHERAVGFIENEWKKLAPLQ